MVAAHRAFTHPSDTADSMPLSVVSRKLPRIHASNGNVKPRFGRFAMARGTPETLSRNNRFPSSSAG
jgi:hypothetical protein